MILPEKRSHFYSGARKFPVFLLSSLIFYILFFIFNISEALAVPNDGTYYLKANTEMGGAGTSISSTDYKVTNFTIGEVVGGKPKVSDTGSVCESGGSGVCKVNPGWLYTRTKFTTSGNFTSTDLLSSQASTTFNSFLYKMTALPAGTTATIQFSRDGTAWYSSAGILGGTDALSAGANTISLAALGWTAGPFYYKVAYTGPGGKTPALDYVALGFIGLGAGLNPIFNVSTTDGQNDYLRYKIKLCTDLSMTANCQTFDQTVSQTGWTGQDAVGSTAYKSGSQAYYTPQTSLVSGTTYYWQAWAIDPVGSNAWSTASSTVSFTTNAPAAGPTISAPTQNQTKVSTTPAISVSATDANSDYIRYKIQLCTDSGFTQSCQTFDQTTSQTGWSGQNAQTSTAYNSGSTATYTVQSALTGKRYFIRAYAIDPAGTNAWGSASATRSFLTTNVQPGPCTSQPGGDYYVDENCYFTGSSEGVDAGNMTVKAGSAFTLNSNQSIVWNPGQAITIEPGASIVVNSSAKLTQSYMFTPSSGSGGYPDPIGYYGAVAAYHMDDSCGCTTTGCTGNTYCSGGKVYNSTGSNDGTVTGTTITSGKMGNARSFNGTSDYVSIGTLTGAIQTVAFWVYPNTTSGELVDLNGTAYISASAGTISAAGFATPTIYVNGVAGNTITAGSWQHIVVTTPTGISASAVVLGKRGTSYFSGLMDEVYYFNNVLSQMEITGLYNPSSGGATYIYQSTNPDASAYRRRKDIYSAASPMGEWKLDEQTGTMSNTAP